MRHFPLLALGLLAFGLSPARLAGSAETPPALEPLRLPAGLVAVYAGSVNLKQAAPGQEPSEIRFQIKVFYRVKEVAPGKVKLLLVRLLRPQGEKGTEGNEKGSEGEKGKEDAGESEEVKALGALQIVLLEKADGAYKIEASGSEDLEMEEVFPGLNTFCPVGLILPLFVSPEEGQELKGKEEVSILGFAQVKAPLMTKVARGKSAGNAAADLEISRQLDKSDAGARTAFEFQGSQATLVDWRELYALEPTDGGVSRIEKDLVFEVQVGDAKYNINSSLRLERTQAGVPAAEEAKRLDALDAQADSVTRELGARKPSAEIEKSIAALAARAKGSLLEDAATALRIRLNAFKRFFEESPTGRRLAQILGKPAPDFTLENLEGKKVKFSEASRGKVTLLSFWGFG